MDENQRTINRLSTTNVGFLDGTLEQRSVVVLAMVSVKSRFSAICGLLLLLLLRSSLRQRSLSLSSLLCLAFLPALCGAVFLTFFCDSVQIFFWGESCTKNNPPWEERRTGLLEECRHNDGGGLVDKLLKKGLLKSGKEKVVGLVLIAPSPILSPSEGGDVAKLRQPWGRRCRPRRLIFSSLLS